MKQPAFCLHNVLVDGTATNELTLQPTTLKAEWISWANGVTGEEIYIGDALIPQVVVKNGTYNP